MKRVRSCSVLLAGLALLTACSAKVTPADKVAFVLLEANQKPCDTLTDGIVAAYRSVPPGKGGPAAAAFMDGAGADAAAELLAGLPFAEKAIRPAASERSDVRNLLVDWQQRQSQECNLAANHPTGDDLTLLVADHERNQKAIREDHAQLTSQLVIDPMDRKNQVRDRDLAVKALVEERRGELEAKAQLAEQQAARAAAEEADAHQLALEDQAREEEKKQKLIQEEEDKEALAAQRREATELEIRMKRERQEHTMRLRQAQGAADYSRQMSNWGTTYRQQIVPFAKIVRTTQRSAASDPNSCAALRRAADALHIPPAPDPSLQQHLTEAIRLVVAASDSCGQKLRDTTAFRLELVVEHLQAIESQLPTRR